MEREVASMIRYPLNIPKGNISKLNANTLVIQEPELPDISGLIARKIMSDHDANPAGKESKG